MTNEERDIQRKLKVLQPADILGSAGPVFTDGVTHTKSMVKLA